MKRTSNEQQTDDKAGDEESEDSEEEFIEDFVEEMVEDFDGASPVKTPLGKLASVDTSAPAELATKAVDDGNVVESTVESSSNTLLSDAPVKVETVDKPVDTAAVKSVDVVAADNLQTEKPRSEKLAADTKAAFTASDGTRFSDRTAYRKYEFALRYTFKGPRFGSESKLLPLRKEPGEIDGQPFEMADLTHCEVVLMDHSEAVQVDYLAHCRVLIGACCDSVFVRNCTGCTFTIACKQVGRCNLILHLSRADALSF
jgi:ferritin